MEVIIGGWRKDCLFFFCGNEKVKTVREMLDEIDVFNRVFNCRARSWICHLFFDFEIFDSISLEKILDVEISKREGGVIEDFSLSRLKKFE